MGTEEGKVDVDCCRQGGFNARLVRPRSKVVMSEDVCLSCGVKFVYSCRREGNGIMREPQLIASGHIQM